MKINYKVSAQELIDAGASLTQVRQGYRKVDAYDEKTDENGNVYYESTDNSFRDDFSYWLPAKLADGTALSATTATAITVATIQWKGSIQDSFVLVTLAAAE